MRICFVGPADSAHIIKWCKWFNEHGHEIHLISFTPGEIEGTTVHLIDVGVDTNGSGIGKLKYLFTGKRIKKIIEEVKPDVVNAHYATSYGAAMALSGIKGYILSVWGSDIYDFPKKSPMHKALLKYSLKKAGGLFSTSQAMAGEAAKYTERKFEITPFGVDMELFNPNKRTRADDAPFTIGTVKTLADLYGIDYILKAVAEIKTKHPEIEVSVRISGDGPQAEKYKELAAKLGITNITVFLGRISQTDAAREWANMDVAVIPSPLYESFGVAAVEAQASGTPVIISDVEGLMETTNPGVSSEVVPKKDEKAIAEAILKLYQNPDLRKQMGIEGRKNVTGKYELNQCFNHIEKALTTRGGGGLHESIIVIITVKRKEYEFSSGHVKTLILLTKTFPYDTGEEFLENEIEYDAKVFERIIIIPTAVTKKSLLTRQIPSNVEVIKITESKNPYVRYGKYIFLGMLNLKHGVLRTEMKKTRNCKEAIGIRYVYGRALRNAKKIEAKRVVQDCIYEKSLLYSYWCADLALTAVILKNKFSDKGMIKAISRAHGYDLYEDRNITGTMPLRQYIFQQLDNIYPCSENGSGYLRERYPDAASKIHTAYLGTKGHKKTISRWKAEQYRIVTCSSIIPLKRIKLVAEALCELDKQGMKIEWVCIGDGPLLNDIIKYTENNLTQSTAIFPGHLDNGKVLKFYEENEINLFINVSVAEGLPVSIMEAISFGIPILATDVGGTSEIVCSEKIGRLIEVELDGKKLSEHIRRMKEIEFNSAEIIEFWQSNFSADKNYSRFANQAISLLD